MIGAWKGLHLSNKLHLSQTKGAIHLLWEVWLSLVIAVVLLSKLRTCFEEVEGQYVVLTQVDVLLKHTLLLVC